MNDTAQKNITVFVTKYALTTGVYKSQGDISTNGLFSGGSGFGRFVLLPKDFALTAQEAETQVAVQLKSKLKSAEKALKKIQGLDPAALVAAAKEPKA